MYRIKQPIIGICLGAQLVAYTLGCEIIHSNKLNVGFNTKYYHMIIFFVVMKIILYQRKIRNSIHV